MWESLINEMKQSIGFEEQDARNLRFLLPHVSPVIPSIVDHFYDKLRQDEHTRAILTGDPRQMKQLRATFSTWLTELFEGTYDQTYYEKRQKIGETHVRAGLAQRDMFTAMEYVWRELENRITAADPPQVREKLQSLHKMLMLELAVMLESYKDSYSEQIRQYERSTMEEKLTRAEHLAKIGQLAASLAHEIKNPLAGISGAIQIIRDEMATDHPHHAVIEEIIGQISRLDATVKDLLQYARPTPPRVARVTLDAVVKRVLNVLQEEPALQRVHIAYEKPPTDTLVYADDAQLEQLLINLLINAAHASSDGQAIHLSIVNQTRRISLIVQDEGKGMTPQVRDRAFEAFFTTKTKGTGLGLSICRRIAEAHNGTIEVASELGHGTCITVTLPHRAPDQETKATA